jgi:hypothetical protein
MAESLLHKVPATIILIWQALFQIDFFTFIPPLFKNSLPGEARSCFWGSCVIIWCLIIIMSARNQYQIFHRMFPRLSLGSGSMSRGTRSGYNRHEGLHFILSGAFWHHPVIGGLSQGAWGSGSGFWRRQANQIWAMKA